MVVASWQNIQPAIFFISFRFGIFAIELVMSPLIAYQKVAYVIHNTMGEFEKYV